MLRFFNANQKNYSRKLDSILASRKNKQKSQSIIVKKILAGVKKNGDKAVINYERKFSKIKTNIKKIKFSDTEIKKYRKKLIGN